MCKAKVNIEESNIDPSIPPIPANEAERLAYLREFRFDLSLPYEEIKGLCEVAAEIAGVPIAMVSLIGDSEQKFIASVGLGDLRETHKNNSFCAHAILRSQQFEIPDTALDERFSSNPFVLDDPKVRSYLGTVLEPEPEKRLGTLCVLDSVPRKHSDATKAILTKLANAVTALLISHREKLELADYAKEMGVKNVEMSDLTVSLQNSTAKLIKAEKVRTEFISTVSHELRTPLTSIKGAIGLLRHNLIDLPPEKVSRLVEIAGNNSEKLLSLVNDILDLQKNDFGKTQNEFSPIDLWELLRASADAYQTYASDKDVKLKVTSTTKRLCIVPGDKKLLDRVMANLLSNAFKFSNRGGQVELDLDYTKNGPQISVRDYGAGIPEGSTEQVFGLFTQVDYSDSRPASGTGLGMYISRQILEEHNATISYHSVLGRGTTFTVSFREEGSF